MDLSYDVDPSGEIFIMIRVPDQNAVRLHVIVNLFEELQATVGN